MQALLFFVCKKYSSYNRDNSLMVERHFGGGKGSIPFYFFSRAKIANHIMNKRQYKIF